MDILVYDGPRQLHNDVVEDIRLLPNQIRAQTICSAISHGTEMNVYRGIAPQWRRVCDCNGLWKDADADNKPWEYPVRSCDPGVWYMGYASVGRVNEVGSAVTKAQKGDIIYALSPHQSQIISHEDSITILSDHLAPETFIFLSNLSVAYNSILDSAIKLGDTVAVSGLGVLGQLILQLAKLSGASKVIGVGTHENRLLAAKECGADYVINSLHSDAAIEVRRVNEGRGTDLVFEASGSQTGLQNAIRIAERDTTVTALGWYQGDCRLLNLAEEFHHNRITIRSSQNGEINPTIRHMWNNKRKINTCIQLLERLHVKELITHRIPFKDAAQAYELIDTEPEKVLQVVLVY